MAATPDHSEPVDAPATIHVYDGRFDSSPTSIPAAKVNEKRDVPLDWVSDFTVDGRPVFWDAKGKGRPVVDARVCGDLTQVHLANLGEGESGDLGRLKREVDPKALAVALIKTEVIMTYVHVEATMTLDRVEQTEEFVDVFFSGEHVYFTNEENHAPLAFVVRVETDGRIRVRNGK